MVIPPISAIGSLPPVTATAPTAAANPAGFSNALEQGIEKLNSLHQTSD